MRVLNRKLLRDLGLLRSQVIAIALVVASGVATVVTTRIAYESLVSSRSAYYARYRFADVFAHAKRAPESLRSRIEAIPGVAAAETRIVADVTLDVPGLTEPATGRLVSLPERREPALNDIYLRRGRRIEPGHRDEVVVSEAFAEANTLEVGDRLGAVLNGRWEELRIVGIGLSPEYIYEIRGTDLFPDPRRFGVIWMSRDALGPAFQMDGAFNDVSLRLASDAIEQDVINRLDGLLERYGGLGAYGRSEQLSDSFISDEIKQNRVFGTILPAVFLGVAAFLLNIVLSRLVATQRDQIAVLKAFGYRNRAIALHYMAFSLAAVALGSVLGTGLGLWLGAQMLDLYMTVYRIPLMRFDPGLSVVLLAIGVSAAAAVLGALSAVRRSLDLAPAEAMRPEPPARFRAGWLELSGAIAWLPTSIRMIWRNVARRPARAVLSTVGISLAVALLIVGHYFMVAIQHLDEVQFRTAQREDLTVAFHEPRPASARYALASLDGVTRAEPFRAVAARLRFGHASRRVALFGLEQDGELRRIVDDELRIAELPPEGVLLTSMLAQRLNVVPGDSVTVEVLEGSRPIREIVVAATVDEVFGLQAYMDSRSLRRLLREAGTVSGAFLRVDPLAAPALHTELKRMPAVAGATSRTATLASFEKTLGESMGIFTSVLAMFASVIAVAVVYNAARIALSERSRELASLRVLGFSRAEVSRLLLGEQGMLTLVALPLGFAVGYRLCEAMALAYQWDLFRMPLLLTRETYAYAFGVISAAALVSGLVVRRRLDRLDLVTAMKERE
jgi:putative ABC transport system permease protein